MIMNYELRIMNYELLKPLTIYNYGHYKSKPTDF